MRTRGAGRKSRDPGKRRGRGRGRRSRAAERGLRARSSGEAGAADGRARGRARGSGPRAAFVPAGAPRRAAPRPGAAVGAGLGAAAGRGRPGPAARPPSLSPFLPFSLSPFLPPSLLPPPSSAGGSPARPPARIAGRCGAGRRLRDSRAGRSRGRRAGRADKGPGGRPHAPRTRTAPARTASGISAGGRKGGGRNGGRGPARPPAPGRATPPTQERPGSWLTAHTRGPAAHQLPGRGPSQWVVGCAFAASPRPFPSQTGLGGAAPAPLIPPPRRCPRRSPEHGRAGAHGRAAGPDRRGERGGRALGQLQAAGAEEHPGDPGAGQGRREPAQVQGGAAGPRGRVCRPQRPQCGGDPPDPGVCQCPRPLGAGPHRRSGELQEAVLRAEGGRGVPDKDLLPREP